MQKKCRGLFFITYVTELFVKEVFLYINYLPRMNYQRRMMLVLGNFTNYVLHTFRFFHKYVYVHTVIGGIMFHRRQL